MQKTQSLVFPITALALMASISLACAGLTQSSPSGQNVAAQGAQDALRAKEAYRAEAFAKEIVVGAPHNPLFFEIPYRSDVGMSGEALGNSEFGGEMIPIASLRVDQPTRYRVDTSATRVFLQDSEGKWRTTNNFSSFELSEGTYKVWVRAGDRKKDGDPLIFRWLDEELAYNFGEVSSIEYRDGEPAKIVANVPEQTLFEGFCNKRVNIPALTITIPALEESQRVKLLDQPGEVAIVGPLSKTPKSKGCLSQPELPKSTPGTYAVFVDPSKRGESSAPTYTFDIGGAGFAKPLTPSNEIPPELGIEAREIARYYGYYVPFSAHTKSSGRAEKPLKVEALFRDAPAQLFVFSTQARNGLLADEPLLLARYGEETSRVIRLDGSILDVRTSVLTADAPGAVATPALATVKKVDKFDDIWGIVAPPERAVALAHSDKKDEYTRCRRQWYKDNDALWAIDPNVKVINKKTGAEIKSKLAKKARRACKHKQLMKAEDKVVASVYEARMKTQQDALESLKTKF